MCLCRSPAGSTSGTNVGREKAFQWMMWKPGVALLPLPHIPNDKGIKKDFVALFSLVITQ